MSETASLIPTENISAVTESPEIRAVLMKIGVLMNKITTVDRETPCGMRMCEIRSRQSRAVIGYVFQHPVNMHYLFQPVDTLAHPTTSIYS